LNDPALSQRNLLDGPSAGCPELQGLVPLIREKGRTAFYNVAFRDLEADLEIPEIQRVHHDFFCIEGIYGLRFRTAVKRYVKALLDSV
jgi:hypothetical protein